MRHFWNIPAEVHRQAAEALDAVPPQWYVELYTLWSRRDLRDDLAWAMTQILSDRLADARATTARITTQ